VDRASDGLVDPQVRQDRKARRTIGIQAGDHVITAADPLPNELRDALDKISSAGVGRTNLVC
jgi:hypothetical protein